MRTIFFVFFSIYCLTFNWVHSQNLIPNPSFEDINVCTEHSAPCAPSGWITPSPFLPEYTGRPGEKHISLIAFNSSKKNIRQYVQTRILCPLEKGESYTFSISLKQSQCIIGSIGILFLDSLIYTDQDVLIKQKPTIDLTDDISKYSNRKQKNWITIESKYIATGKEKYILIGNFQNENEQTRDYIEKQKAFSSYRYSIDNVSLINPKSDSLCDFSENIKSHWYSYHIRHSQIKITEFTPPKTTDTISTHIVRATEEKVDSIRLSDVIFEFNSSILSTEAKIYIEKLFVDINLSTVDRVLIEGHTDNVGKPAYNLNLSIERAISVKQLLTDIGVTESSIITSGKGDSIPIADNNNDEGRKKNRRIELLIIYK